MIDEKVLILATKRPSGHFEPDSLIGDLDNSYARLEYEDVLEDEVQTWEYPSGKIFQMRPDREVSKKDYYSTPAKNFCWPKLTQIGNDKDKVEKAYNEFLRSAEKTFLTRLKGIFKQIK